MPFLVQDQGVSLSYGRKQILKGVDLNLQRGQRWILTGPNGAGKSTYLRSFLDQRLLQEGSRHKQKDLRVELLPQASAVETIVPCTVNDFLFHSARHLGRSLGAFENAPVNGLGDRLLSELSGGQLQRVLIFRSLLAQAELLLLDEPFSALDFHDRRDLWRILDRDLATTCQVIVLHNPQDILQSRGRLLVIESGEMHQQTMEEYRQNQLEQLNVD